MAHLHRYKIISETKDGIREVCTISGCGDELVTRKGPNESIDNAKYLKEHKRDFLQPDDKMFKEEWGTTE